MTTDSLAAALADLQTQLPHITKAETATVPTKTGGSYKYTYADLAQISAEVLPLLGKLGLSFSSKPTLNEHREFVLAYKLRHISGQSDGGEYPLPKGTPQEIGGAITYARRYCLCAVTGVAPDDDDDAAAATRAQTKRSERPTRQAVRPKADEPENPAINGDQQRTMQGLFRQLGVTDRDAKLAYAVEVIGRPIASSTELTHADADSVIAKLRRWAAQDEPAEVGA